MAKDRDGLPLGRLGMPSSPAIVQSRPPVVAEEQPWYESPWLWTGVGAAVIGAAVIAAVVVGQEPQVPASDLLVNLDSEAARFGGPSGGGTVTVLSW